MSATRSAPTSRRSPRTDNGVPFYVALPSPTIDCTLASGTDIPIEERDATEVTHVHGRLADGGAGTVAGHARRIAGAQLRLRRDAGAAGDCADYRAGRRGSRTVGHRLALSRSRRRRLTPGRRNGRHVAARPADARSCDLRGGRGLLAAAASTRWFGLGSGPGRLPQKTRGWHFPDGAAPVRRERARIRRRVAATCGDRRRELPPRRGCGAPARPPAPTWPVAVPSTSAGPGGAGRLAARRPDRRWSTPCR